MIDYAAMDQGSGLRQLALRSEPTVLTMLQHGDRVAELTLLWQVCSALQNYGDRRSHRRLRRIEGHTKRRTVCGESRWA